MATPKKPTDKPVGKKTKQMIPRSVQNTIPYQQLLANGLVYLGNKKYSKTILFGDITYQIARQDEQEEIFLKYAEFLNYFDSDTNVQLTINTAKVDKDKFREETLLKFKHDDWDVYRKEYNDMIIKAMQEGREGAAVEKFITISTEAENADNALRKLTQIEQDVANSMQRINVPVKPVGNRKRMEVLANFFRGTEGTLPNIDIEKMKDQGLASKDIIAPDSFLFKPNYFMMGNKYAKAMYINQLPAYLSDRFIADLTDNNFDMTLTINVKPLPSEEALTMIRHKLTGMEANKIEAQKKALRSGYDASMISHDLQHSLEEANDLLDDVVNKNQKMFLVNVVIVHKADSLEELNLNTKTLESKARKSLCILGTLQFQQEKGMAAVLPLGNNPLQINRALTTESTAIFIPFTSQDIIQKGGMYYGTNALTRSLMIFNRKNLKNPNGFILGTPGSGKSFSAKREMVNVLLNTDDDVIIIDPEREYTPLATNFNGSMIRIGSSSKNYINPLDMSKDYADVDDPITFKSEFILSICETLFGGKAGMGSVERTIIDRVVRLLYADYVQDFDERKLPTLMDLQLLLENQPEPEAKNIALALEIYTKGSLDIFAHKTNVNMEDRLIVFDIKDLGTQTKTMGLLVVLDAVWNRITKNRGIGRRTWIYIDEIYLLFANEYSANFLFELYKRARKWGGIPTGITQNVEDLLRSDLARRMLSNSDFIYMLNQATLDRQELAHILSISEPQLQYVTNTPPGCGLIFLGDAILPFIDKFPKDTQLYKMMTTNFSEEEDKKAALELQKKQEAQEAENASQSPNAPQ